MSLKRIKRGDLPLIRPAQDYAETENDFIDDSRELDDDNQEESLDTDQTNPIEKSQSYTWWIVIIIVIVLVLVGLGLLIWWFTRDSKSDIPNQRPNPTNPTVNPSGTNRPIIDPSNPVNPPVQPINPPIQPSNPVNPPIQPINPPIQPSNPINPPVNPTPMNPSNPSDPIDPSNPPSQPVIPPVPPPPNPVKRVTPAEMGYPFLTSSTPLQDPFIPTRNPWVPEADRGNVPYPLGFHLARLFMRIDGKKYYLQFNDPYKPNAWPDPGGDLFIWTQTPSQTDVYSSFFRDVGRNKGIRLAVYQHPTQTQPKPGARIIYSVTLKAGTNNHRLSTTDTNGLVYLIVEDNLIYLTLWTISFKEDGTILSEDATLRYYVKNGYGRFMSAENAAREGIEDYRNFPIGIENAPVDRTIYDS